jgi:hypothetical protein
LCKLFGREKPDIRNGKGILFDKRSFKDHTPISDKPTYSKLLKALQLICGELKLSQIEYFKL